MVTAIAVFIVRKVEEFLAVLGLQDYVTVCTMHSVFLLEVDT